MYGHVYVMKSNLTFELYFNENVDKNELDTKILNKVYQLDFKGDLLAKRNEIKQIPNYVKSSFYGHRSNSRYLDLTVNDNNDIYFARFDLRSKFKDQEMFNSQTLVFLNLKTKSHFQTHNYSNLQFFVVIKIDEFDHLFIGIDKDTFKLNIVNFYYKLGTDKKDNNYVETKLEYDFDELFRY